jgi:hypothetical protein
LNPVAWLVQRWNHFWFAPSAPSNLGLCRVVFFGMMVVLALLTQSSLWADAPAAFWMPITLFKHLGIRAASAETLAWLDRIWLVSLVLSCVGLFTRSSTAVAFIVGAYLLGLPHSFGKTHHSDAILLLTLCVLAFSRCGDSWSLDRMLATRRGGPTGSRDASSEYTWPIHLVWALMAIVFFSAGVSKVRESGLDWILSDNLRYTLLRHHYSHVALIELAPVIAQSLAFTKLMAAGSVALELSAPLALFSRRLRLVIVPSLLLLQTGIWLLMGVSFAQYLAAYALWVPWDRVADRVALRQGRKDRLSVVPEGT